MSPYKDPEEKRAHGKRYYQENKEKFSLYGKRKHRENPESARERARRRRQDNPLYNLYTGMMARCYSPKAKAFYLYGARGIEVCHEWRRSFAAYKAWALDNGWQPGLDIDRKDNDGDYSPENCQCITRKENNRKRPYVKLTIKKAIEIRRLLMEGMTGIQLAKMFGVSPTTITNVKKGRTWQ